MVQHFFCSGLGRDSKQVMEEKENCYVGVYYTCIVERATLNAAKVFRMASDSWRCVLFTSIQKL